MACVYRIVIAAAVMMLLDSPVLECEAKVSIQKLDCVVDTSLCLLKFKPKAERDELDFLPYHDNKPSCLGPSSACCQQAVSTYKKLFEDLTDENEAKLTTECELYGCATRKGKRTCTFVGCRYPGCSPPVTSTTSSSSPATSTTVNRRPGVVTRPVLPATRPTNNVHNTTIAPALTGGNGESADVAGAVVGSIFAILVIIAAILLFIFWWRRRRALKGSADRNDSQTTAYGTWTCWPLSKLPEIISRQGASRERTEANKGSSTEKRRASEHEYAYINNGLDLPPAGSAHPHHDGEQESIYTELDDVADLKTSTAATSPSTASTSSYNRLGEGGGRKHPSAPPPSVYSLAKNSELDSSIPQYMVLLEDDETGPARGESKDGQYENFQDEVQQNKTNVGEYTVSPQTEGQTHEYCPLDLSTMVGNSRAENSEYTPLACGAGNRTRSNQPACRSKEQTKDGQKFLGGSENLDTREQGTGGQYFILEENARDSQHGGQYFILEEGAAGVGTYSLAAVTGSENDMYTDPDSSDKGAKRDCDKEFT